MKKIKRLIVAIAISTITATAIFATSNVSAASNSPQSIIFHIHNYTQYDFRFSGTVADTRDTVWQFIVSYPTPGSSTVIKANQSLDITFTATSSDIVNFSYGPTIETPANGNHNDHSGCLFSTGMYGNAEKGLILTNSSYTHLFGNQIYSCTIQATVPGSNEINAFIEPWDNQTNQSK